MDLLTVTRDGRLAVLELKADEDIHLVLQAASYWLRIAAHQSSRNSSATDTFRRSRWTRGRHCCSWWLRPYVFILRATCCCAISRARSKFAGWESAKAGGAAWCGLATRPGERKSTSRKFA